MVIGLSLGPVRVHLVVSKVKVLFFSFTFFGVFVSWFQDDCGGPSHHVNIPLCKDDERGRTTCAFQLQQPPFKDSPIILPQQLLPASHCQNLIAELWIWHVIIKLFSSVAQSCLTLWDPMDSSIPGFPVHHQLPELAQTHVHQVSDSIQLSHPLSSPSPPTFNLSQHQGPFQWVSSSNQTKVLELQLHHQSLQWIFRTNSL